LHQAFGQAAAGVVAIREALIHRQKQYGPPSLPAGTRCG
jgi:hypothetical protein